MDLINLTKEELVKEIERLNKLLEEKKLVVPSEKKEEDDFLEQLGNFSGFDFTQIHNELMISSIKNIPNPSYILNTEGRFVGCNIHFENYFHLSCVDLIGKTPYDVLPIEIADATSSTKDGKLDIDGIATHEIVSTIQKNEAKTIIITESVYNDLGNNLLGVVGVLNDITEKRKAEKALIDSERKLREVNEMKDKFFSIISHDLKNPFASLLGFSEMLLEDYESFDEEERKNFLNEIYKSAKFSFRLLNNLLLWSKSTMGKIVTEREVLSVKGLFDELLPSFEKDLKTKSISLEIEVDPSIQVIADRATVLVILENLISNAIKFTSDEGKINLFCEKKDRNIFISVEDNGIGLTQDDIEKLFRIDVPTTKIGGKKEKGTGLGLIISSMFAKENEGELKVSSEPNKGSKFTLSLKEYRENRTREHKYLEE